MDTVLHPFEEEHSALIRELIIRFREAEKLEQLEERPRKQPRIGVLIHEKEIAQAHGELLSLFHECEQVNACDEEIISMKETLREAYKHYLAYLMTLQQEKPKIKRHFSNEWYEGELREIAEIYVPQESGKESRRKMQLGFNIVYEDGDTEDLDESTFIGLFEKTSKDKAKTIKEKSLEFHRIRTRVGQWHKMRTQNNRQRLKKLVALNKKLEDIVKMYSLDESVMRSCNELKRKTEKYLTEEETILQSESFCVLEFFPKRIKPPAKISDCDKPQQNVSAHDNSVIGIEKSNLAMCQPLNSEQSNQQKEENGQENGVYVIADLLKYDLRDGIEVVKVRWKGYSQAGDTWEPIHKIDKSIWKEKLTALKYQAHQRPATLRRLEDANLLDESLILEGDVADRLLQNLGDPDDEKEAVRDRRVRIDAGSNHSSRTLHTDAPGSTRIQKTPITKGTGPTQPVQRQSKSAPPSNGRPISRESTTGEATVLKSLTMNRQISANPNYLEPWFVDYPRAEPKIRVFYKPAGIELYRDLRRQMQTLECFWRQNEPGLSPQAEGNRDCRFSTHLSYDESGLVLGGVGKGKEAIMKAHKHGDIYQDFVALVENTIPSSPQYLAERNKGDSERTSLTIYTGVALFETPKKDKCTLVWGRVFGARWVEQGSFCSLPTQARRHLERRGNVKIIGEENAGELLKHRLFLHVQAIHTTPPHLSDGKHPNINKYLFPRDWMCPLPDELLNVLRKCECIHISYPMSWIGISVMDKANVQPMIDVQREGESVGEICVIRPPSRNCFDLFNLPQLPESIRDIEQQIRTKRPTNTVLFGLYVPPPTIIAFTKLPTIEIDAIEAIIPLSSTPKPLPPFLPFQYDEEQWTKEILDVVRKVKTNDKHSG